MGTNYYLHEKQPCDHCKRPYPERHIGKSSAGWVFSFRGYWDEYNEGIEEIKTVAKWREVIDRAIAAGGHIEDEYRRWIDPKDFWDLVEEKKLPWGLEQQPPRVHSLEYPSDRWRKQWVDEGCSFSGQSFS